MSRRAFPALVTLLLGCAGTAGTAPTAAPDASADVAADIARGDTVDVGADVADVGGDGDVPRADDGPAVPGPIDGAWRVTDILCGAEPASAGARAFITAPNRSEFTVDGDRSTYTLSTPTCVLRLESSVAYPSPGRAVFTARGPFTCVPAGCMAGCGTTPAIPYVYDHSTRGAALVMRTVGETPDITCTAAGQQNPITYTYASTR
ncbi:MAG: hypothetical protein U0324_21965 [Polyangiales bacterium]